MEPGPKDYTVRPVPGVQTLELGPRAAQAFRELQRAIRGWSTLPVLLVVKRPKSTGLEEVDMVMKSDEDQMSAKHCRLRRSMQHHPVR